MTSTSTPDLLSLPFLVRRQILTNILLSANPGHRITPYYGECDLAVPVDEYYERENVTRTFASILLVNRQLAKEGAMVLYGGIRRPWSSVPRTGDRAAMRGVVGTDATGIVESNVFHFYNPAVLRWWLRTIGERNRRFVRAVELEFGAAESNQPFGVSGERVWLRLIDEGHHSAAPPPRPLQTPQTAGSGPATAGPLAVAAAITTTTNLPPNPAGIGIINSLPFLQYLALDFTHWAGHDDYAVHDRDTAPRDFNEEVRSAARLEIFDLLREWRSLKWVDVWGAWLDEEDERALREEMTGGGG